MTNFEELKDKSCATELSSAVLLYSLTSEPNVMGVSRDELIMSMMNPDLNINDFEQSIMVFQKYASYFHFKESRYFFDIQENADAKVEYQSLKYKDKDAQQLIYDIYKNDIFNESNCIVYSDLETTKEIIQQLVQNIPLTSSDILL